MKNKIKYLVTIVAILLIIFALIRTIRYVREQRAFSHTYRYENILKIKNNEVIIKTINDLGIYSQVGVLLSDKSVWNKLALSNHFKEKFHNPNDIIRNIGKYESIDIGSSYEYLNKKTVCIMCTERENILYPITGKNVTTEYIFEYKINEENLLDDLILLKETDIDSMTSETYAERIYVEDNTKKS